MNNSTLPRRHFNRARVVSLLAGLGGAGKDSDPAAAGADFAERLAQWLGVADAIALYSALAAARPAVGRSLAGDPGQALSAVRDLLTVAIQRNCSAGATGRLGFPVPRADLPDELVADFEPYRRFYLAHQREMESRIGPLRAEVRTALAAGSSALQRAAALDEVFDQAVTGHERRLLMALPGLLETRFAERLAAYRSVQRGDAGLEDRGAWVAPGGWLAGFRDELREALLAELDLRLLPVAGLVAAWHEEMENRND